MRDFFAFRVQHRQSSKGALLFSRRLFHQFLVDAFSMVEVARLKYVYTKQEKLRAKIYKGLRNAVLNEKTEASSLSKCIVLPATFIGGARYMIQNYQDAMAIYKSIGLFKEKLDMLIKDIHKNKLFGISTIVIYTIEFQKRGLPHAHILLFLAAQDKFPAPKDIDRTILAEIPDRTLDPKYYEAVKSQMMYGPCGIARKNSPCMDNGCCSQHFSKKFVVFTTIDHDGYTVYRCRNDGRTIDISGIPLDNCYVPSVERLSFHLPDA
ncbi:uncharacterized protein [Arachis hypogaea]|uniref:uncharacterized protein n=1 Tax=Arachis hypogaea TaxID=3818 RepID=UPI003B226438